MEDPTSMVVVEGDESDCAGPVGEVKGVVEAEAVAPVPGIWLGSVFCGANDRASRAAKEVTKWAWLANSLVAWLAKLCSSC